MDANDDIFDVPMQEHKASDDFFTYNLLIENFDVVVFIYGVHGAIDELIKRNITSYFILLENILNYIEENIGTMLYDTEIEQYFKYISIHPFELVEDSFTKRIISINYKIIENTYFNPDRPETSVYPMCDSK